jgi:hypothetical protein
MYIHNLFLNKHVYNYIYLIIILIINGIYCFRDIAPHSGDRHGPAVGRVPPAEKQYYSLYFRSRHGRCPTQHILFAFICSTEHGKSPKYITSTQPRKMPNECSNCSKCASKLKHMSKMRTFCGPTRICLQMELHSKRSVNTDPRLPLHARLFQLTEGQTFLVTQPTHTAPLRKRVKLNIIGVEVVMVVNTKSCHAV